MEKAILAILAVITLVTIFFGWQYSLTDSLSKNNISCGGDFSYINKCPNGTYCKSLGQGHLAGGKCEPYLGSIMKNIVY